ncbi:MAG TPA: TasA family protein, partial [Blastococcus sp.]|nr:TasA family protein [Blastococcus sp.]
IGAAAAVAGMGTFGTFTDSTTPVTATVASGTVEIDVTGPAVDVPVNASNFVPGDSVTKTVNLVNTGTAPLASVLLNTTVTSTANVLTDDKTNGLQLAIQSCSVAWAGSTCTGELRTVVPSGSAAGMINLANPFSLAAGATDYLSFKISLPTSADNSFQGKSASLSLVFTGTQRAGNAG